MQEFNKGNTDFLMALYEEEACFSPRPGEIDNDSASIRRSFQGLIDMGAKLQANKREFFIRVISPFWLQNGLL